MGGRHYRIFPESSGREAIDWRAADARGNVHLAIATDCAIKLFDVPWLASAAPANLILTYGSANGFGWKLNEVIGAQIVSVPTTVAENIASHLYRTLLLYIAATFLVRSL